MSEKELLELLIAVVQSNTEAMNQSAAASEKMSIEVRGLRRIIGGAQEKIGGEIGPIIDRMKETQQKLSHEREEVRRAGSSST